MTYPIAANAALCDTAQVEQYLSRIFRHVDWEPGQQISLLGIGEKGTDREGVFKERQFLPPGPAESFMHHLRRWASWNSAAFIVPCVLHAAAQIAGDVTLDKVALMTAIILDLDSGDVSGKAAFAIERLGRPSLVVASGGCTSDGEIKRHLYWLLDEPSDEVERVAALRKTLAAKTGGDQSFGRATQVIRIPGSVHAKNGNASLCSIIERSDADYSLDALAEIIEDMEPMAGLPAPIAKAPLLSFLPGGQMDFAPHRMMDFSPREDTALVALHRDVVAGGEDLTRFSEASKVIGFHISEIRAGRMTPQEAYTAANGWMLQHMTPAWPQARFDQEFQALLRRDLDAKGPFPVMMVAVPTEPLDIEPTPATWPHSSSIPPRPWIFGKWLLRGAVTAIIAPGGIGKSSLVAAMALSVTSGKEILGKTVWGGPQRFWSWNLEDNGDNLARARVAASMHHWVSSMDCGGRLFVDSGPEGATLCTAVEDRNGFMVIEPVMEALCQAIQRMKIDVLVVDPFVSSHAVNENDNNKIDAVTKAWARVAQRCDCSIVLVHHSSKQKGEAVTGESSRGASALNNAARMTLVLNRMTHDQADTFNIDHAEAASYFNVADDKHNLSAAERADWFKLVSVDLENGNDTHASDKVGVVTTWEPPRVMDGIQPEHLYQVQKVLHAGQYRFAANAKEWAGHVIGEIVKIDSAEASGKSRIIKLLALWIKSGALKVEVERCEDRKSHDCVRVGAWQAAPAELPAA